MGPSSLWHCFAPGTYSGVWNMACDEALLETVRAGASQRQTVVRVYGWSEPTFSLGVHQPERDFAVLAQRLPDAMAQCAWVRRPTGGRAILHGADVSYAVVSNSPDWLSLSVADSYCAITTFLKEALKRMDVEWSACADASTATYGRSPLCMDTRMPTDLLDGSGEKRMGSAQLRRAGALLQHGAIFLPGARDDLPETVTAFAQALEQTLAEAWGEPADHLDQAWLTHNTDFEALRARYASSASGMLASASTSAGSHFTPAS